MKSKLSLAHIKRVSYGLLDFPDSNKPRLWFEIQLEDGFSSVQTFYSEAIEDFLVHHQVRDIRDLEGRFCAVEVVDGDVHFVGLLRGRYMLTGAHWTTTER